MTRLWTGFELSPAGTAIPTAAVAGDGDAFASGNDGAGTSMVSDTTAGALASGAFCAKIAVGTTAAVCHRNWGLATSTPAVRLYVYLTAYPNAALEVAGPVSSGTLLSRIRISTSGTVSYTVGGTVQATTTGTIPLNTLVRIEADWLLSTTAGTIALDCYTGHSMTPLADLSLTGSALAFAAASTSSMRLGVIAANPTSFTFYTDGWAVADTGPLGPVAPSITGVTAVARVRGAAGSNVVQVPGAATAHVTASGKGGAVTGTNTGTSIAGTTAVARALAAAGAATVPATITGAPTTTVTAVTPAGTGPDWFGSDPWDGTDPWRGPHIDATTGATGRIQAYTAAGAAVAAATVTGSTATARGRAPAGRTDFGALVTGGAATVRTTAAPGAVSAGAAVTGTTTLVTSIGRPGTTLLGSYVLGATGYVSTRTITGSSTGPLLMLGTTAVITVRATAVGAATSRYQVWTGTGWKLISPQVWTGATWARPKVTVVPDD